MTLILRDLKTDIVSTSAKSLGREFYVQRAQNFMSKRSISTRSRSRLFLSCHSFILVSKIGLYAP